MSAIDKLVELVLGGAADAGMLKAYAPGEKIKHGDIEAIHEFMQDRTREAYEAPLQNLMGPEPIRGNIESGITHAVMEAIKPTLIEKTEQVGKVAHITVIVNGQPYEGNEPSVAVASTETTPEFILAALLEAQGAVQRAIRLTQ